MRPDAGHGESLSGDAGHPHLDGYHRRHPTIIHAPSSTKNSSGERDPEMHQTKKGNQWYFGLKAHIGVDGKETVVRSVCHFSGQRGG